jgi:pimeloyl-ACP methyl ester carboxylesterase
MQWRKVALTGGAAIGAAALFNEVAGRGVGPLPNPVGGEEGRWHWRGHQIAWTRRGEGPAVLLVHAIHAAAWSYEWRHAVDRLAAGHTVWTLDLLGFGRSDRPAVRYSAALYVALLDDFAREVVGEPCALVGSSLSGAYTAALAARDARRFPALVVVTPVGVKQLSWPPNPATQAMRALIESPVVGTAAFNALVSKPSMKLFLEQAYQRPGWVTPELLDAYHATAHQPNARFAPAAFVGMGLNLNVRDALRRLEQPLLITWGEQAKEVPRAELEAWRELRPDAEVAVFDPSGSLPHDERAEDWCERVLQFLGRTHTGAGAGDREMAGSA